MDYGVLFPEPLDWVYNQHQLYCFWIVGSFRCIFDDSYYWLFFHTTSAKTMEACRQDGSSFGNVG
jgi:hypothetical protein